MRKSSSVVKGLTLFAAGMLAWAPMAAADPNDDNQNNNQAEQIANEVVDQVQGAAGTVGDLASRAIGVTEFNQGLANGSITGSFHDVNGHPECLKFGVAYDGTIYEHVTPIVIDGTKMIPC